MTSLEFVRISNDGMQIIVRDEHGRESALPMDDRIAAAMIPRTSPTAGPDALSPREIQSRIRAGADVRTLSETSGTSMDRIMAFAVPILQERAHVAVRARGTLIRRASGVGTLDDIVIARLQPLGVTTAEAHWDSRRLEDGRWEIKLTYDTNEGGRSATWLFDSKANVISPNDDEAHWLLGEPPVAASRTRDTVTKPTIPVFQKTAEESTPDNVVSFSRAREERIPADVEPATEPDLDDPVDAFVPDDLPSDEIIDEEPSEESKPRNGHRKSIPSWDEILFGSPNNDD